MEHIIKQNNQETIKRFELSNGNIWLIKQNDKFGVGTTKREALKLNNNYAHTTIPPFLYEQGTINPKTRQEKLWALPGMVNFIWSLISFRNQSLYNFHVVYHDESNTVCVIVRSFFNADKPKYFWVSEPGLAHEQVRKCVYQLYIEIEKGLKFKANEQNKKLGEWQKFWYSKLQSKKIL